MRVLKLASLLPALKQSSQGLETFDFWAPIPAPAPDGVQKTVPVPVLVPVLPLQFWLRLYNIHNLLGGVHTQI
jgi:hypothetical protein